MDESKMTFKEYSEEIRRLLVMCGDSGVWFLIPDWRHILKEWNLTPDNCEEQLTLDEVKEILELEVKRLNALDDARFKIQNSLNKIIFGTESLEEANQSETMNLLMEMLENYKRNKEKED